jgi:hypothetical protein
MTIVFNWYAPTVGFSIMSVEASYLGLRVYFSNPVYDDAELRNPNNYSIVGDDAVLTSEISTAEILSVEPEDVESPTYVDLVCTDLTDGMSYLFTIVSGKIQDAGQENYMTSGNSVSYDGVSVLPYVQTVRAISETLMEVVYSKEMSPVGDLMDVESYSFDKGLIVREVIWVSPGVVHLVTTKQTPSELYTLTVQ